MQKNNNPLKPLTRRLFVAMVVIPMIGSAATFQQGQSGYTGAVDTQVRSALPNNNLGSSPTLVAASAGTSLGQSLIRFDNIFGAGANQIPAGATILSATLTLRTTASGNSANQVRLHRMLIPWAATNTWNSMVDGVSADDIEAASVADATFTPSVVSRFETNIVTAAVQSWSDGAPNYGWAIIGGADDWVGDSSEATTLANRPLLTVTFSTTPVAPTITTQPQSRTNLNVGDAVELRVNASGSSLRYQWFKNSNPILDATNNVLPFPFGAQLLDNGTYHVVVSNSLGTVTSSNAVLVVTAQPTIYDLVNLTNHVWRFTQTRVDLGTAWRETNYNDSVSPWLSGRGVFAFENNATINPLTNTVLQGVDAANNNNVITYYFRTAVLLTNDPASLTLVSSNFVDDGMVVYVNGRQAFRYNMPSGTISAATVASAANPGGEGVAIVSNIPPDLLIQGTNVFAVEVHQNSAGSSDVVFGMNLRVFIPPPSALTITDQPQSITVEETKVATFTVGVAGGRPEFQWLKDGVAIVGETRATLTIPVVRFGDAASYSVIVSNAAGPVISLPATLTVTPDTTPPTLVDADGSQSLTNVIVSFSERVGTGATNTSSYQITNTSGGTITITRATVVEGTNVVLATPPRTPGQNYLLVVNNVRDVANAANLIPANSMLPVSQSVTLVEMNTTYKFYDPFVVLGGGDNPDLGTAWKELNYDDSDLIWGTGNSIFFFGTAEARGDVPGTVGSSLDNSEAVISYFRKRFLFAAPGSINPISIGGLRLLLSPIVDDGAVFYLNGTEIYRLNMPSGTIAFNTPSSMAVGSAGRLDPITIGVGDPARRDQISVPASIFVTGTNLLAVSLHQAIPVDLDKVYGAELKARVQSFVAGPVIIAAGPGDKTVIEGQPVTLEVFSVGASRFQWQRVGTNGIGTNVAGANGASYTIPAVPASLNGAMFRVAISNATVGVTSTNATLRVLADTNPPVLLSAILGSNNTSIVLSFNEPLLANTATNRGNYAVTNALGSPLTVTSAVLTNGTNVILSFSGAPAGLYTVVVNNVRDASVAGNLIGPNSAATVGAEYFIPFVTPWKYLLINTNDTIHSNFMASAFNDSSWSGPSNAPFYLEPDALAGPKNTQLALFVPGSGDTERINTFYFRKAFVVPIGSANITFRLRHIVDDGFVLFLNGVEIFRFGYAATATITASSQPGGHENAIETATVTVTNLLGGTNILAAFVQQNGATSSDMAFAVEITASIPSVVIPNRGTPPQITSQPQSRTNSVGTSASFSVTATGAAPLTYQWRKGNSNIPGATNATYTISSVAATDAGTFSVVVSNPSGSVTSADAVLTVTTTLRPPLTITANADGTVTVSWNAPGFRLQETGNLGTAWSNSSVANGVPFTPSGTQRYFQLVSP